MALELTRKAGRTIEIGGPPTIITLTVLSVGESYAVIRLQTNDDDRVYTLNVGQSYTIVISVGNVRVTLVGIDRGDARFSFVAARHIRIERPERHA